MLQAISSSNPGSPFMYVVDTRPKVSHFREGPVWRTVLLPAGSQWSFVACCVPFQLNAMANRAAGKGYESEDNYANIKFHFLSIENIHVMRSSQQKMLEGTGAVLCSLCLAFLADLVTCFIMIRYPEGQSSGAPREFC